MLSKQKQKAIIEAMLFVSTEPISLNKFVKRLQSIERREGKEQTEDKNIGEENGGTDNQATLQKSGEAEGLETEDPATDDESGADEIVMGQLLDRQRELEQEITGLDVKTLLKEIQDELLKEDRGIELVTVAKGYQLRTKYDISVYLKNDKIQAPSRFSPSSLETLAIVAYQQPITRQKIEELRGVDSGGVMKTLLDKGILRVVGRSDDPGKPLVYGTANKFLEVFGLEALKDLPSLQDYHSLYLSQGHESKQDSINSSQRFGLNDLAEDDHEALTAAEQVVLEDLNDSIRDLRKVEKNVLVSAGIAEDPSAESPGPVVESPESVSPGSESAQENPGS